MLKERGIFDYKKNIISIITSKRTTSLNQMDFSEAQCMIIQLYETYPPERLKSLIFCAAYRSGLLNEFTRDNKKVNAARLDRLLKVKGPVKKALNDMNYPELTRTYRHLEKTALQGITASELAKEGETAVKYLLDEMQLTTTGTVS